jgi:transcriptional regulator GlxA family with amidase domain
VQFPSRLRRRTIGLFAHGPLPASVGEFASSAGLSEAAIRSAFRTGRLATPRTVIDAARLALAFNRFDPAHGSLERVAVASGFGTLRTMERRSRSLTGLSPGQARRSCTGSEYAHRLALAITRRQ